MASAAPVAATPEVRRFLLIETIVNAVLSGVLSALFVVLVFGGRETISLWGMEGLAFDLVPTVIMITFMMTVGLTLFTRFRCARGKAPRLDGHGRLPRNVLLRALGMALAATTLLVPASLLILALFGLQTWTYGAVMAFKIAYGAVLAAVITPIILKAAMRDGAGA